MSSKEKISLHEREKHPPPALRSTPAEEEEEEPAAPPAPSQAKASSSSSSEEESESESDAESGESGESAVPCAERCRDSKCRVEFYIFDLFLLVFYIMQLM